MRAIIKFIFSTQWYSRLSLVMLPALVATILFTIVAKAKAPRSKINYRAHKLEGRDKEDGMDSYKQLVGHVIFQHEDFTLYADSVKYFDKKGLVTAIGHLRVVDKEGGVMTAEEAQYNTQTKLVQLLQGVTYQRDSLSFFTDELEYSLADKVGHFRKGAIMKRDNEQLSSQVGSYDQKNNVATFSGSVALLTKDYHIFTDSLLYHTDTQAATLYGPTKIVSQQEDRVTLTTPVGGEYNTRTQYACFQEAHVEGEKYSLRGDLLEANPEKQYYTVTGKACFTAKEHKTTLMGEYAFYQSDQGVAELYGDPLLQRIEGADTLFLLADTLKAIEDKTDKASTEKDHTIQAYHNVKIYNQTLQGIADSMVYHSLDSSVYFYDQPVFWSYDSQLTSDQAHLKLTNESLEQLKMAPNAFIVSEDSIGNHNQVKGRELVVNFIDNKINYIDILGNGEGLYFILDGPKVIGMNYIKCGHMRLEMEQRQEDSELKRINFFVQPVGTFYPIQKVQVDDRKLEGLSWRSLERPTLAMFLARQHETSLPLSHSASKPTPTTDKIAP